MDCKVTIVFDSENIKKYIKNYKLIIKKESFEIKKKKLFENTDYELKICINSQEKINKLHKIFDFFIKNKCFFWACDFTCYSLYNIDKDLFYKSGYWFLNSEKYWDFYLTLDYLALTYNSNISRFIKNEIINSRNRIIKMSLGFDLGIIKFIVDKCKSELSKNDFDKFIELFSNYLLSDERIQELIRQHGINLFKNLCENNILNSLLESICEDKEDILYYYKDIVCLSIEINQTEIIDYLLKYGFPLDIIVLGSDTNFCFDLDCELLLSLIKNDNIETFTYVIENIKISNGLMQRIIKKSGEFITKEYIKILLNNGKLDLNNLKLLNKSVKNNPNKKLKKYVKKLILNEKN